MSEQTKSVAELAAETKAAFDKSLDAVKGIAQDALGKAERGEELTAQVKRDADEALTKMNELTEQVSAMEQKLSRAGSTGDRVDEKSFGERFIEDERVKAFAESGSSRGGVDMRAKATITSATTNAAGSAGAGVEVTRLPGIVELPQRRLTVRDLITPGRMDGSSLEYVRESGFVNNAAPVAEGAPKPSSDIQFELVSTSSKVVAHWMKASRQILSDFSQLRSIIDQRLMYGLGYVEEQQLLNGDGTGQNLLGIMPQATAYAAPAGAAAATTSLDVLRLAMLQAALAEFPATGHVMNPIDWTNVELLKDTQGRYIIGNPQGTTAPTLWALPVVTTQAIAAGRFLTGAFKMGAQLFDRWEARVEAAYVEDDFTKNLITILAEERLALAVYRPEAFVTGALAVGP
ncbi:phage major capsid protein [Paracoccus sp. (in: a-proteobacteria)]|uniref:phage major capsid protein n=1 Tax=Paracoccus sp. TaxID=267 RepID=UPI0028A2A028|nr:phage major capsid protein [Paracoccus sp. (in: a-proteobacteria)]